MLRIYSMAVLILANSLSCRKADLNNYAYYSECFLKGTEHEKFILNHSFSRIYLKEEFYGIYFGALHQDLLEEEIKYLHLKKNDRIKQIDSCDVNRQEFYFTQMNENKIFLPLMISFDTYLAMFPEEAEQKFNRVVIVRGEQEIVYDLKLLREKDRGSTEE